jgi:hypothetical protein
MEIILVIALCAGLGLGYVVWKKSKSSDDTESNEKETETEVKEVPKTDKMLTELLHANIIIRENVSDKDVVEKVEEVIDLTRELIVPMNTEPNIGQMTPVVNRMYVYIGKIVNPFMKMNNEMRKESSETIVIKLDKLSAQLKKVKSGLENQDQAEFDKQAEFITAMFPDADDNL